MKTRNTIFLEWTNVTKKYLVLNDTFINETYNTVFFIKKITEKLEVGEAIISKRGENSENMLLAPLPTQLMSENSETWFLVEYSYPRPPSENIENKPTLRCGEWKHWKQCKSSCRDIPPPALPFFTLEPRPEGGVYI